MPDERRRNAQARARLAAIEAGYRHFSRQVKVILAVLAAAQIGLGLLSIHLVGQNDDRGRDVARVVDQIQGVVDQIQDERERNIRDGCQSQNARNRETKQEIRNLVGHRQDAEKRLRATFLIIDRLAPVRDCEQVIARSFGGGAGEP